MSWYEYPPYVPAAERRRRGAREVQKRAKRSRLSKREMIRRLGTSPAQLYLTWGIGVTGRDKYVLNAAGQQPRQ